MSTLKPKAVGMAKSATKQATNYATDEALEFLKLSRKQVTGNHEVSPGGSTSIGQQATSSERKGYDEKDLVLLKIQSKRQIEALEKEIEDIIRKRAQEKQQIGMAEVAEKRRVMEMENTGGLPEPSSKRKRGMLQGMKGKVDKMKKKTEMRAPPSG